MEAESGSTKNETKSIIEAAGFAFNQAKNQDHLLSKSRSEVVYKKDQISFPKPRVRANSILEFNSEFSPQYQPQQYHQKFRSYYNNNSQYNQINSGFATKSSNASRRAWSDITYIPHDTRTELTNYSDPGPQVYNPQTFNFPRHVPTATIYENNHNYYPNQPSLYGEARSHKPRIAASAMVDIGDNVAQPITTTTVKPRKAELDELMKLSSDPKVQRKFLDLRISNKSLLTLNVTLESTVKEQSDKLATIPSFEAMMETQQKQLEHLNKVEELINTLSTKMTEQDDEIKVIKSQIIEKSDEKGKTQRALFYDPKSLPLKSLPNIIFDRVYDDVTILFSVVTSLLYTVYIFPVIVMAKTAQQLVDKSRDKLAIVILQLTCLSSYKKYKNHEEPFDLDIVCCSEDPRSWWNLIDTDSQPDTLPTLACHLFSICPNSASCEYDNDNESEGEGEGETSFFINSETIPEDNCIILIENVWIEKFDEKGILDYNIDDLLGEFVSEEKTIDFWDKFNQCA
nr:8495_t:CDS:10 [Entrophospora candida]